MTDERRLLRWYPPRWRARYGDEMVAMVEDHLAGARPTLRLKASLVRAGAKEWLHELGLAGESAPPGDRVRAAALLVLCCWSLFVVAGASFAKLAEHFDQAMPSGSRRLASVPYGIVEVAAVLAALAVVAGALLALPAFRRLVRQSGWATVKRKILRAATLAAATVIAVVPLAVWAHHLSPGDRDGGSAAYTVAFLAVAASALATLAALTVAAVDAGRRVSLSRPVLATESGLAAAVALAMVTITAATAVWWAAVAVHAPWFLHGTAAGRPASAFDVRLAVTMGAMACASLVSLTALVPLARGWRLLRQSESAAKV